MERYQLRMSIEYENYGGIILLSVTEMNDENDRLSLEMNSELTRCQ